MARLVLAALVVIIPAVLAAPAEKTEKQGRAIPIGQGLVAGGSTGLNYANTQAATENHNKKNFGLNYASDQGSSTNYGQTGLQAAAAGGIAQAQVPQYPVYQYQYPQYYPVYPPVYPQYPSVYPHYPSVYPGVGHLGVGSNIQVPGVAANSGGVFQQGFPRY